MCQMIYIGSDELLPMTDPFDEKNPKFHVIPAGKREEAAVREHLRTEYVVYAGSTTGCGCNFEYESAESIERKWAVKPNEMREILGESTEDKKLADDLFGLWNSTTNEASRKEYLNCWLQDKQSVDDLRAYLDQASKTRRVRVLVTEEGKESTSPRCVLSVAPDFFGGESFQFIQYPFYFTTLLEVSQQAIALLVQLQRVLQSLAQPPEVQLRLTPDFVDVAEQLAGEFYYLTWYALNKHRHDFSDSKKGMLKELNAFLVNIGFNDRWNKEALYCDADWNETRGLAKTALNEFGWLDQIPAQRKGGIYAGYAAAYYNKAKAYYSKREYDKSWEDVNKAQALGYQIPADFLDELRKASGRQN